MTRPRPGGQSACHSADGIVLSREVRPNLIDRRACRLDGGIITGDRRVCRLDGSVCRVDRYAHRLEGRVCRVDRYAHRLEGRVCRVDRYAHRLEGRVCRVDRYAHRLEGRVCRVDRYAHRLEGRVCRVDRCAHRLEGLILVAERCLHRLEGRACRADRCICRLDARALVADRHALPRAADRMTTEGPAGALTVGAAIARRQGHFTRSVPNGHIPAGVPSPYGDRRRRRDLLPRGRRARGSGGRAAARLSDFLAHVPQSHPRPGRSLSRHRARLSRLRAERHARPQVVRLYVRSLRRRWSTDCSPSSG